MLLFFLRHVPTTLIVGLAVPASLLVTLGAMYFFGLTLNILTMMGMLLAIGMLVDNSVVITESIFRHRQLTPGQPLEATLAGVKEVGVATLAGTFSTIDRVPAAACSARRTRCRSSWCTWRCRSSSRCSPRWSSRRR